ncbi:MAG: NAD-dependent epimerase/dehydratase [Pelagibacteraceae bacterium]|nr:NAD-dependent epimerase/dehydratase [Pelagibacteraceae bacterium]|tara:strand:+ start:104 stop:964 length:861 start_codon:yes stop_codon:yes gene_type:complete
MKKKILILGSEGQIGGHLVEFFKQNKNYEVLKFDIVLGKKFDIRNFNSSLLENNIKKSSFIFFLAFDVGGSRYLKKYQNSYNFLINNLLIMSNAFRLLKKYKKKFIFASSQMSNMDFSSYGTLKRLGEDLTKSLNGIYVKFWNVYGIEKDREKSHVITDFILMALKNKKIKMLTSGKESREFLYATDCSEGLYKIMKKFSFFVKKGKELHLTTGKRIKIIDIAKLIKIILSKKNIQIKIKPSNKNDDLQNNMNNTPNKFFLNYWKPKYKIEEGIKEIIDYYQPKQN